MSIKQLDNEHLYYSMLAGASEVIAAKDSLNAINVFPVPDGDTGSNLAALMTTILAEAKIAPTPAETSKIVAQVALRGARGNSGIIFAQYLAGFSMGLNGDLAISMAQFSTLVKQAAQSARSAIAEPVEGTIITVMREWAEAIESLHSTSEDFLDLLNRAYEQAKTALKNTTGRLKELKNANVVDAGAKGFVHFIEGFARFLKTGVFHRPILQAEEIFVQEDHLEAPESLRYCTEALVSGKILQLDALRKDLKGYGDSIILAGNNNMVRLHLHTDRPADVFVSLRKHGDVIQQKVDDMKKQYEAAHQRKYPYAILTDSVADLPPEFVEEHQVYVIPMQILFANNTFYDKLTIDSERFYQWMDQTDHYPSSAMPAPATVENMISFLLTHYEGIVAITVSQAMSGTYNVFEKAINKIQNITPKPVYLVNSKQNSGAQGLVVMKAAEALANGANLEEVRNIAQQAADNAKILVSVPTLRYMVRSGRVSKVTGFIGKIMNLKPVISIDSEGQGIIFEKAFTIRGNTKKIFKEVERISSQNGIEHYAILHANNSKRAGEYAARAKSILGFEPLFLSDISSVVALNAGIGSVAIAVLQTNKEG